MKWISQLLSRASSHGKTEIEYGRVARVFGEKDFRIVVVAAPSEEHCDDCGQPCFRLLAEYRDFDGEPWKLMIDMHETKVWGVLSVLQKVARYLEGVDRQD